MAVAVFLRRLLAVCIGLALFVALLTAGVFVGLFALAVGILLWGYIALRRRGVLQPSEARQQREDDASAQVIEVDYEVIESVEERQSSDKA